MKGASALAPRLPGGPKPNSGQAAPSEDTRNIAAARIIPPRRPSLLAAQPESSPPSTQPKRALETVQPERLSRAVSVRWRGAMKFASIELTAPEITAVSYPNRNP